VDPADLKIFSNEKKDWIFEKGSYRFYIGPSSDDDALLTATIDLSP
jgi:hypothetical protein